ncbi:hypothetical protein KP79_PYT01067 [Mizuhopecten yessoensis]|uniref:Uncharacterized protein n=1 Tax=Mizuhopecten yessoensis TaxID=6573 RepID=A0A210QKZ1_MIZYE|nr:hypothetical protein KP79_PYT01067 [Mizuhopecten yessoensis]
MMDHSTIQTMKKDIIKMSLFIQIMKCNKIWNLRSLEAGGKACPPYQMGHQLDPFWGASMGLPGIQWGLSWTLRRVEITMSFLQMEIKVILMRGQDHFLLDQGDQDLHIQDSDHQEIWTIDQLILREMGLLTGGSQTIMVHLRIWLVTFLQMTETSVKTLVQVMQIIDHKEEAHLDFMMALHMDAALVEEIDHLDLEMVPGMTGTGDGVKIYLVQITFENQNDIHMVEGEILGTEAQEIGGIVNGLEIPKEY